MGQPPKQSNNRCQRFTRIRFGRLQETGSIISSDPQCKDGNVRFANNCTLKNLCLIKCELDINVYK